MLIEANLNHGEIQIPFDEIAYDKRLNKMSIRFQGKVILETVFSDTDAYDTLSICGMKGNIQFNLNVKED